MPLKRALKMYQGNKKDLTQTTCKIYFYVLIRNLWIVILIHNIVLSIMMEYYTCKEYNFFIKNKGTVILHIIIIHISLISYTNIQLITSFINTVLQ